MESQQQGQYHNGGQEGRGEARRAPEQYQQQVPPAPPYPQPGPSSPPPTSSPFAFAPPPLSSNPSNSSIARPALPLHHSEPPPHQSAYQYYSPKPPPMAPHHNSFPMYPGSAPMGHRSISNETPRHSPAPGHMPRPEPHSGGPSLSSPGQPSNPGTDSPYAYSRHPSYTGPPPAHLQSPNHPHQPSPRPGLYPPHFNYHGGPSPTDAPDMPRSLSYPSSGYQPHHPYQPIYQHHPHPMSHPPVPLGYQPHHSGGPPALNRSDTDASISNGLAGVDISKSPNAGLGYTFSNRLPLVERPFKCDECVQSFNRNHDLKRHKRIHLSVKPFGCDKCGKTFSRKDALRRHWLVKGCRGAEGATAPIVPLFPINSTPGLSPPTPVIDSTDEGFPSSGQGFNHPSAPPPLSSLPTRQPSNQSSIIITPTDSASQSAGRQVAVAPPMDEPLELDPVAADMQTQGSGSSSGDGYFDGVVGIKSDGTAVLEKSQSHNGPSSFPPAHPSHPHFHHPYRRSSNFSASHQQSSPTGTHQPQGRPYTPSSLGGDGKPVFAMPFARQEYAHLQPDGMFAPQVVEMEKVNSQMSHGSEIDYQPAAPRWHRPSFPFPPTNNVYNPNFEVDVAATPMSVPAHGYGQ